MEHSSQLLDPSVTFDGINPLAVAFLPISQNNSNTVVIPCQGDILPYSMEWERNMRVLGLDGGISSIGWAVVELDFASNDGRIVDCGTRTFHSPEGQSSTGKRILKNAERRGHRAQRRVIRRRRQRMALIRRLFKDHGLLKHDQRDALAGHGVDPLDLRVSALDAPLAPHELALALGHIARHRGFESNRKGERSNKPDDDKKMLQAIDINRERLSRYRSVGEMLLCDPKFADRRRNRTGEFTCSILREDQKAEVRLIFRQQRQHGNHHATQKLEDAFSQIAFFQRPLQSSVDLIGDCPFVDGEKRAPAFAPSFERFRFLSKLVTVRIVKDRVSRALTRGEIETVLGRFAKTKTFTWRALRNSIGLEHDERFDRVGADKESNDFVRSAGAAKGTATVIEVLTQHAKVSTLEVQRLLAEPEALDQAVTVISFNEDLGKIREGLAEICLPDQSVEALCKSAQDGTFDFLKGTGHISCAAARRLNEHLASGLRYDEACAAEGWDHAAQRVWSLEDIRNPVAQKAAREILKQVKVLETEYGPFDRIHVEMAREVGKSIDERSKIERGQQRRAKQREDAGKELKACLRVENVSREDILRYELWKEQNGRCLYTGRGIEPQSILAADNTVQVDHILPFSRFADNSFHNKTLCFTSANQNKKDRSPFEWKNQDDPGDWARFVAEVESCKTMKGLKKRNYLLMDAKEREGEFLARNLNDTRFALRVVLGLLRKTYPDLERETGDGNPPSARRRVFARPGAITAVLRRAWGVESLKKDADGERRNDDRHHALDAIVTACCSERLLQAATRHAQEQERRGEQFELRHLPDPWGQEGQFRREVEQAVLGVFVSRPESARLRGKGHDATIRQVRAVDGEEKLFERKPVEDLTLQDLERIPLPQPYGNIADPAKLRDQTVENLRRWMKGKEDLKARIKQASNDPAEKARLHEKLDALRPLSAKGDLIRKVRLELNDNRNSAVMVRGGSADRTAMVRVDVFSKRNNMGKARFYLVPIYRNDVYTSSDDKKIAPPSRAVLAKKKESEWTIIDSSFDFLFSLVSLSLVEITRPDGEVIVGYFRSLDRNDAKIKISEHHDLASPQRSHGTKTLLGFKKLHVDRLGRIHEVRREKRTWRGKVCT